MCCQDFCQYYNPDLKKRKHFAHILAMQESMQFSSKLHLSIPDCEAGSGNLKKRHRRFCWECTCGAAYKFSRQSAQYFSYLSCASGSKFAFQTIHWGSPTLERLPEGGMRIERGRQLFPSDPIVTKFEPRSNYTLN